MVFKSSLSRLLHYLRPWNSKVYLASFYSAVNKLFDIAPEVLIGVAVDLVVKKNDSFVASLGFDTISEQVYFLGFITFLIWALESFFEYLYMIEWRGLAQKIEHKLRVDAYDHAQKLDLSWHEKQTTGNICAILNDDINQLERFINNGVNQLIQVLVSTVVIGLIFFYISPMIAMIAVLPVPIIFLISLFFQKRLSPRYKKVREKVGTLNASIVNNLIGIQILKAFITFSFEKNRINKISKEYQDANIKTISLSSAFNPIIRMGVLAGFLGTILIGSHMALNGTLAVGSYSVLVFLTQRFLWPFTSLSVLLDDFERSMASSNRIFELKSTHILIKDHSNAIEIENLKSDIMFENVRFFYNEKEPILERFNMHIPFGSSIGIVGDTGSGKTTISKLLLRFYDPQKGNISIGNIDIKDIKIGSLRKKMAIVTQEPFLFNSSIKDNISYGSENVDFEEIQNAAEKSQAIEFISKFENGFDTLIGERGQTLSGGQKQRISIARALLKKPDILIFDEATSSVDNKTEQLIQKSFFDAKEDRTSIIIAHRLSTIRNCDKIYVLKEGAICQGGNHDQLINQKESFYNQLWNIQTGLK